MENTHIEWADHTFNPWEGCSKVSAGCKNCYAETRNARFGGGTATNWGPGAPRRRTSAANWKLPLKWNREAEARSALPIPENGGPFRRPRVFCASLADWLDPEVPIEWLVDLLRLIHETPHLDWLLLTKRPHLWEERIRWAFDHIVPPFDQDTPTWEVEEYHESYEGKFRAWLVNWCYAGKTKMPYPQNVWIGTSVEDQAAADVRIPQLLKIPAKVRFLSCEPLLGPVDFRKVPGFNKVGSAGMELIKHLWVIVGGESGPGARPMHPDWARFLRNQCQHAGVPFLFKQWGEWVPGIVADLPTGVPTELMAPDSHVVARVGKRAAGRLLDGIEHNEFPNQK
jgi:protein gp37